MAPREPSYLLWLGLSVSIVGAEFLYLSTLRPITHQTVYLDSTIIGDSEKDTTHIQEGTTLSVESLGLKICKQ
jgi:hypothetical protein